MRYVRIQHNEKTSWGVLEGDIVKTLRDAPYEALHYDGRTVALADCRLLAPCLPGKVVCLGRNYYDHIKEFDNQVPENPTLFMKTPNCINDPDGSIHAPDFVTRLDYEGELALVIKKRAKGIRAEEAGAYILGYTCLNDVTARDIQKADGQWTRGKCMDGFCPVGPVVTDEVDPADLHITTRLNGAVVQDSTTALFITKLPALLEFITACITLEPGDVVTTGTPAGVGPMVAGDTVEVEIQGIGILKNHVV